MTQAPTGIILHHYPASPFSEKVRIAFGLKQLDWQGVTVPTIMPKPDLMPLTGGYRKTPVMQIGADVFCDTQIILHELERRFPQPSLCPPGTRGVADAIAFWADHQLFANAVGVVFGTIGHRTPEDFRQDRTQFMGRPFDADRARAALPAALGQMRAGLAWIDDMLGQGHGFALGTQASLADLALYHCVWFVQRNLGLDAGPLNLYPKVRDWAARMAAIGHGRAREIDAKEALDTARAASPTGSAAHDPDDTSGLSPGQQVSVMPDDTGRDPVAGELVAAGAQEIVIRRVDPAVGEVMVHFPRAGFIVRAAP